MRSGGFSIIELLIVMVIITIVGAIALPMSIDYQQRNDLDVAQVTFAQSVRRAQQLSMTNQNNSSWGVTAVSGNITIFKGASYVARDVNYDENYDISTAIIISGQAEYDFSKTSGSSVQTGIVTFTNGSYQKTVGVNAKGVVNY